MKSSLITQGPLPHTTEDFWKVIDNSNTSTIVAIVERNQLKYKCAIYWPYEKD